MFIKASSLLLSIFFAISCNKEPISPLSNTKLDEQTSQHFTIIYENAPNPTSLTKEFVEQVSKELAYPQNKETLDTLISYFGNNPTLFAYYFVDSNGDGEKDWYYDKEAKKFQPNSLDIDGDGITNFLDQDPFDKTILNSDLDLDNIPDHLDWDKDDDGISDLESIDNQTALAQKNIFIKTNVIALNQEAKHNARTINAALEVMEIVYSEVIKENNGQFPGLKFLSARPDRFKEEEKNTALAYYNGWSQTITILDTGRKQSINELFATITPLEFYSTMTHEMAHALHKYLKIKHNKDIVFDEYLSKFWNHPEEAHSLFKNKNSQEWKDLINKEIDDAIKKYQENGNVDEITYLMLNPEKFKNIAARKTKVAQENNIISSYALSSPSEYFAESVPGYAMHIMLKKRFLHLTGNDRINATKAMSKIISRDSTVEPLNMPQEGLEYIDSLLNLNNKLVFNAKIQREDGFKGKWEIISP